jgi:hypothetical protein
MTAKRKLEEEAINEILVADTDSESGAEAGGGEIEKGRCRGKDEERLDCFGLEG